MMFILKFSIILVIPAQYTAFSTVSNKYDIEEEAHKLFGSSIPDVIHMFRMSPDYQKILDDNVVEIKKEVKLLSLHVLYQVLSNVTRSISFRDDLGNDNVLRPPKISVESAEGTSTNETDVQILEGYPMFHSKLSITERNRLKEHGYELADKVMEIIINELEASVDKNIKSTTLGNKEMHVTSLKDEFNIWQSQPTGGVTTQSTFLRTGKMDFLDSLRLRAEDNSPPTLVSPFVKRSNDETAPNKVAETAPTAETLTETVVPETTETVAASLARRFFGNQKVTTSLYNWRRLVSKKNIDPAKYILLQ